MKIYWYTPGRVSGGRPSLLFPQLRLYGFLWRLVDTAYWTSLVLPRATSEDLLHPVGFSRHFY